MLLLSTGSLIAGLVSLTHTLSHKHTRTSRAFHLNCMDTGRSLLTWWTVRVAVIPQHNGNEGQVSEKKYREREGRRGGENEGERVVE